MKLISNQAISKLIKEQDNLVYYLQEKRVLTPYIVARKASGNLSAHWLYIYYGGYWRN